MIIQKAIINHYFPLLPQCHSEGGSRPGKDWPLPVNITWLRRAPGTLIHAFMHGIGEQMFDYMQTFTAQQSQQTRNNVVRNSHRRNLNQPHAHT